MFMEGTGLGRGHARWMPEGRDDPVVPKLSQGCLQHGVLMSSLGNRWKKTPDLALEMFHDIRLRKYNLPSLFFFHFKFFITQGTK